MAPHLNQNGLFLGSKHSAHESCRQPLLSPWDLIPAEDAPRRSRGTAKATTISARHQNHSKADGGRPAERAEGRDVPPGPIAAIPWASCQTARLDENPKTAALEAPKKVSKNTMLLPQSGSPVPFVKKKKESTGSGAEPRRILCPQDASSSGFLPALHGPRQP